MSGFQHNSSHSHNGGKCEEAVLCHECHISKTEYSALTSGCANSVCAIYHSLSEPVLSQALHVFLSDTIMLASSSTSKGHLVELPSLINAASRSDALPFALEAVALASLANRFHRSDVQLEAMRRYIISIRQLRSWDLQETASISSIIACIVLLGMYEIINASYTDGFHWLQHLDGMTAFMQNSIERNELQNSEIPCLVLGTERYEDFTSESSTKSVPSISHPRQVLFRPARSRFHDLCTILPKVQNLFKKSAIIFKPGAVCYEKTLSRHRGDALALKSELHIWSSTQPETTRPQAIQRFTQPYTLRFPGSEDLICPTTRADIYSDYFVACAWTSYRQCQLHLTDLLARINRRLSQDSETYTNSRQYAKACDEFRDLTNDVCAAIPYMLVGEQLGSSKPTGSIWLQGRPPKLIGGFNLLWILFTISILDLAPMTCRRDMKTSLLWIGRNLGIRQATALAHMEQNPPGGITAKGDALRWAGFLV